MYFLNINKPKGISSFDVIKQLRKRLKIKQIGHSGTLDPLASGVLQIGVSKACTLLDYLDSDKTYIADMQFGYVTKTYDAEGEKEFSEKPDFSKEKLLEVLNSFLGKTLQIPPKYSAIKINGKKACDIMRGGKDVEIPKREIEIYSIELLEYKKDFAKIKVSCKKGTYIRSLVNDIGLKLGCGAYMADLTRIQAGIFKIENSNNLDDEIYNEINPLDALNIEKYKLNDNEFNKIINGIAIKPDEKTDIMSEKKQNEIILLTKNNKLVSIAYLSDNLIKPKKVFRSL